MNPVLDVCRSKSRHGNTAAALPVALCGAFLLFSGCASSPEPTVEMQAAKQAIADAESAQAAEHAAGELSQARTKLASASTAVQDKEMDEAKRLAEQARVDAELASARTAAVKAQAVNEEMKRSTQTLIEEMGREADQATTGTTGTSGTSGTTAPAVQAAPAAPPVPAVPPAPPVPPT